ncbi:hypothetical protein COOONC_21663 [Cooperia oncophora]
MGSPALEKTNIVVKNASGDTMKIYGKLKCKITMKGVNTEGDAYVTPHSSLLGLEWIRANEKLMYHIEMIAAEVKANCNPRLEEERPNPEKIEAIKNMSEPKKYCPTKSVPRHGDILLAFVPSMKDLRGPLDARLKKDAVWKWSSKEQEAFRNLKGSVIK